MRTLRACFLTFAALAIGPLIAVAMSPGSSKSYWKPESVSELSPDEVQKLTATGCLIKSYRGDNESPRSTSAPDQNDLFMLTRAELAAKGQTDLAVLCKSTKGPTEQIVVLWGGPKQCTSRLLMAEGSRYYNKYGPHEDYYGDVLKAFHASEVLRFIDGMYKQYDDLDPAAGTIKRWRAEEKDIPAITHDALHFSGAYNFVLYCHETKWVPLLDGFMDFVND